MEIQTNSTRKNPKLARRITRNGPLRLPTRGPATTEDNSQINNTEIDQGNQTIDGLKRIKQIQMNKVFRVVVQKLRELVVLNTYKQDKVQQEWMKGGGDEDTTDEGRYLFIKLNKLYFILVFCLFLADVLMIWFVSVQSVFILDQFSILPGIWQTICIFDILISLNTTRIEQGRQIKNRLKIFKMYVKEEMFIDILCIVFIIVQANVKDQQLIDSSNLILVIGFFIKAMWKYGNMRPFIDHNFAKQHVTLVTSFAFLIAMGHVFALALYLIGARTHEQSNWLRSTKALEFADWDTKYIFSLYWAFTTMVTVGYGDITPQNKYEVIVVIIVQIIGTSIFGYMINIIGMTLSELKSRNEALQKELTITDKISKCFSINDDLTYRLKSFLRNNYKVDSSFSIAQEKKLLQKLNPILKKQLLEATNTKVIKKSIFFLTHFTRVLQNKLSVKLIKKILQPGEPIAQMIGDEALYIIEQGCIDISVVRQNRSKSKFFSKKVKNIHASTTGGISPNVYGYTQFIVGKPVNIVAASSGFSIAYQLKRRDFLQIISTSMSDYESMCQLRDRFLSRTMLESIQVSQLVCSTQHFCPNRLLLVRKNNSKSLNQERQQYCSRDSNLPRTKSLFNLFLGDRDQIIAQNFLLNSYTKKRDSLGPEMNVNTVLGSTRKRQSFQIVEDPNTDKLDCARNYTNYMNRYNVDRVVQKFTKFREIMLKKAGIQESKVTDLSLI